MLRTVAPTRARVARCAKARRVTSPRTSRARLAARASDAEEGWRTRADAADAPPARRLVLGALGSSALALGSNFLGVTERAMDLAPTLARERRLDVLYPVGGYARCYKPERGYEFVAPRTWAVDQTMARRNSMRNVASLDPPSLADARNRRVAVAEPDVAYGPIGSSGEENVSVIASSVPRGFDLGVFGDAEAQATWLLANVLAKEGSGKTGELVNASTRRDGNTTYYTFEYTIRTSDWFRHNVAVFVTRGSTLYTFVAQVPETRWPESREAFYFMADSFRVFVPSG